ncbi:MAG: hypothetical protein MZV63_19580 [Marinilabiliales bacterium]|nr:hypothetical protein [Marinilabiliales bacterium]
MFESLTEKLGQAMRNLRGVGKLSEENMAADPQGGAHRPALRRRPLQGRPRVRRARSRPRASARR